MDTGCQRNAANVYRIWGHLRLLYLRFRIDNTSSRTLKCIGAKVDTITHYQTDYVHTLTESKEKRLRYVSVKVVRPNVIGTK